LLLKRQNAFFKKMFNSFIDEKTTIMPDDTEYPPIPVPFLYDDTFIESSEDIFPQLP
jgi:hypothetical protein